MSQSLKISGKKMPVAELTREQLAEFSFEHRPGGWILGTRQVNGKPERVRFFYHRQQKLFWSKFITESVGHQYFGERLTQTRGGSHSTSASDLTAQFPGKVRKVLVTEGVEVQANASLLMVEAMKMEFAIKAPARGRIKKVLIAEGQQLTPGQQLIDFEEIP